MHYLPFGAYVFYALLGGPIVIYFAQGFKEYMLGVFLLSQLGAVGAFAISTKVFTIRKKKAKEFKNNLFVPSIFYLTPVLPIGAALIWLFVDYYWVLMVGFMVALIYYILLFSFNMFLLKEKV